MKPQLCDSYFLHLKEVLELKVSPRQLSYSLLSLFCFRKKMAMILGFIFLCMLQAAVPQGLQGPRPIPGRGDSPGTTPPPFQPEPTPGPPGCKGEFHLCIDFSFFILFQFRGGKRIKIIYFNKCRNNKSFVGEMLWSKKYNIFLCTVLKDNTCSLLLSTTAYITFVILHLVKHKQLRCLHFCRRSLL